MTKSKRILIAAGGTGGHFYPGLVLAKTLAERGWQPLILVRKDDSALGILEREGVAALEVDLSGLPRSLGLGLPRFLWKLFKSLLLIRRVLRDFEPAAVVGMGGYLTFPAAAAAALRGTPRLVHESNAMLGLANNLSAKLGAKIFWGLPPQDGRGEIVGTPIRPELWQSDAPQEARKKLGLDPDKLTVLVFGGSQGARGINRGVPKSMTAAAAGKIQILHLSGAAEEHAVRQAYAAEKLPARVTAYLGNMRAAYSAADLVVCRAGAGALAELAAQKLPAILVPYPSAAAGHQEINARVFERVGAAIVVLEKDLPSRLPSMLAELLVSSQGSQRRAAMSAAYARLALPAPSEPGRRLADAVEALAR